MLHDGPVVVVVAGARLLLVVVLVVVVLTVVLVGPEIEVELEEEPAIPWTQ